MIFDLEVKELIGMMAGIISLVAYFTDR